MSWLFLIITFTTSSVYILLYGYSDVIMLIPGITACILSTNNFKKILTTLLYRSYKKIIIGLIGSLFVFLLLVTSSKIFHLASLNLPTRLMKASNNNMYKAITKLFIVIFPINLLINIPFALGEELGWRGYLFNTIKTKKNSFLYKSILVGFWWGLWHIPFYIYYNISLALILLFMLNVQLISIFYSYLFEKSQSIWPSTIAHASHNSLINYIFFLLTQNQKFNQILLGEEGLICTIGYFIIALSILSKKIRNNNNM